MKKISQCLLVSVGLVALTACSTGSQNAAPIVDGNANSATSSQGLGNQAGLNGSNLAHGNGSAIYFDLNQSKLLSQYQGEIDQYANYLKNHPNAKVKIAGYTDKSGSRPWNLSLSQMRAKTVAKALEARGVHAKQIQVIGYGEEYPVLACHGKNICWRERRAEIHPVAGNKALG